jgi:hypothetical protein
LIERLLAALARHPTDSWLRSQTVRVLTENRDVATADSALRSCLGGTAGECDFLRGYVRDAAGEWQTASQLFDAALNALTPSERCKWSSVEPLIDPRESQQYRAMPCSTRQALDAAMWWLATPLFSDAGNRRFTEHIARLIRNQMVSAIDFDAHHDLRPANGSDAVAAMRLRYGWPQHLFWAGSGEDRAHTRYQGARNAPPFPAAEYASSNSSTMSSLRAGQRPHEVRDSDFVVDRSLTASADVWPHEFYLHPKGYIGRLLKSQLAVLRRPSSALVLFGTTLEGGVVDRITASSGTFGLYFSSGPGAFERLQERAGSTSQRYVLSALVRSSGIISVEYSPDHGPLAAAVSRFGVPAETLVPLAAGQCAVSEPMLIQASAVAGLGITDVQSGLLGDLQLLSPKRIGVAWESYGGGSDDSETTLLRVVQAAAAHPMVRLGRSLGLAARPVGTIALSWKDGGVSRVRLEGDSATATRFHEVVIDLATLGKGSYELEIEVTRSGCTPARSARQFSIVR